MDSAIYGLVMIVVVMVLCFFISDMANGQAIKENIYNSVRAVGQNSLLGTKGEIVTEVEMLENWIANYCLTTNNSIEKVEISFIAINSNPQYYVVNIKATDKYLLVSNKVYFDYTCATTIIE